MSSINLRIFLILISGLTCSSSNEILPKWTHVHKLGSNGFEVKWNSDDPGFLTLEMSAYTKGYVAIGFSPHGDMPGSDIALGWVDKRGIPHLKDYHGIGNESPIEDSQQDYELIAGSERDNRTIIVFRRRWHTCDPDHDMKIGNDTIRLIWAWNSEDPKPSNDPSKSESVSFNWHGTDRRGTKSVFMRTPPRPFNFPDEPQTGLIQNRIENSAYIDFKVNNVHVDEIDTMYYCTIIKVPNIREKHHMIGFRPILTPENKPYIHHMVVYKCIDELPVESGQCYEPGKSFEWDTYCFTILFTWAIGAEGEMLPDHLGIPIGGLDDSDSHFFKLEIHYNNADKRSFYDNSGLRIFYTKKLREFEAGILITGSRISPFHLVPPEQEKFTTFTFCSSECTTVGLPNEGIKLVSVMLHAHLSARKIRVKHIRNGQELHPVAEDNHYDFNFQQFRIFENEINILPGDELIISCDYETLNKDSITLGGISTKHEMCQAYFFYYPKLDSFIDCRSQPEFYSFFNGIGIQNITGDILTQLGLPLDVDLLQQAEYEYLPLDDSFVLEKAYDSDKSENPFDYMNITGPIHIQNLSVGQYLKRMNWRDNGHIVERHWKEGLYYTFCAGVGVTKVSIKDFIRPFPRYEEYLDPSNQMDCRHEFANPPQNPKTLMGTGSSNKIKNINIRDDSNNHDINSLASTISNSRHSNSISKVFSFFAIYLFAHILFKIV